MRNLILLTLFGILLAPLMSYAVPIEPVPDDCPCNTLELPPDGPTGLFLLTQICPRGMIAPGGRVITDEDKIVVRINDPRREYRVEGGNEPFCSITQGAETAGALNLSQEELQACRQTVSDACLLIRPIPTISEWGLIAMAGVLGLAGLFVIRRKRVTA